MGVRIDLHQQGSRMIFGQNIKTDYVTGTVLRYIQYVVANRYIHVL